MVAPFLGSMANRTLKAQSPAGPRRLIVMFTHYGCITTRFFPRKSHGRLTASDLDGTTLQHLAPYVDKLLMPRGIRAMNEWTCDMLRGQGNDYHLQVVGSYFTCQPVTPNSNDPFDFDPAKKTNAKPLGPSLDHVIAQQLSPDGAPLFLRVGNGSDSPASAISYSAREESYPGMGTVSQAFEKLTGLFSDGSTNPDTYQAVRGKSIVDLVGDDLETLERFDMSDADRDKLEAWKALLHETGTVAAAECREAKAVELGLTPGNLSGFEGGAVSDRLMDGITDTWDRADIYSNLAVLAAVCNANPVIFLKYPANHRFAGLGHTIDSDSLAHRIGNAGGQGTCAPGVIDMLHSIDDYYAKKFAHLVGQLDAVAEGDGTVLDGTAAVWFQEASDGGAHNLNNLPIVQVGSAGGYFKTGWAVNVEDGSPDLTQGNSEAVCGPDGSMNFNACEFPTATDPSVANAPINKYYCALMNALGVKAGADGFPAPGGTEEVSRYGMYDKTEDFIGGGVKEPRIHSPGEYSELRANA
ncbi:MAG TPA: DUF1552 domain-containing protein [Polyangiaceae bacterium]